MASLKVDNGSKVLILLVAVVLLHGVFYATMVLPWQAPDEPFHYEYAAELGKRFHPSSANPSIQSEIIASMARWDFWKHQNQIIPEPLPWGFAAIPFFKTIRYLDRSPIYYYILLPFYLLVANQSIELRLIALRLVNLLFGAGTVGITFLVARALFPKDNYVVLGAPAFIALLPMFSFISGSINNDNLANLLSALFVYLLVVGITSSFPGKSVASFFALLAVAALALLAKRSTIALFPLVLLLPPAFLFRRKLNSRRDLAWRLGVIGLEIFSLLLLALRIWQSVPTKARIRNLLNFHYPLSDISNRFVLFFGSDLWWERTKTNFIHLFQGFWGHFGWQNIPLDTSLYIVLLIITLLSILGFFWFFLSQVVRGRALEREQKILIIFMLFSLILVVAIAFIRTTILEYVPLQGRYIFPALVPVSIFFVLGLGSSLGSRLRNYLLPVLVVGLVVLDFISWAGYMLPVFYNV